MLPTINCPATCELCGKWLPDHTSTCPRNGVHPSQWSVDMTEDEDLIYAGNEEQPNDPEQYAF